jgi:hypothetical protein
MKFGLTNVQTHRGAIPHVVRAPRFAPPPKFRVRWVAVLCIGLCAAFWTAVFFGVAALIK